jgi:hypothetical protein
MVLKIFRLFVYSTFADPGARAINGVLGTTALLQRGDELDGFHRAISRWQSVGAS